MSQLGEEYRNKVISEGTLEEADIFSNVEELLPEGMVEQYWSAWRDGDEEITARTFYDEMFAFLNTVAPEGCYFGKHPQDAENYGFWEKAVHKR